MWLALYRTVSDSTNSGEMQQDASASEWPNRLPSMSNIYQPLDSSRQEIRLLYVEGRQNAEAVLTCTLETVSLLDDPKPTYEAISYCWAEVSSTATIELNGTPVDVPGSAAKVLRQFQLQSSSRILWIDAVCIYFDRYQTEYRRNLRFGPPFSKGVLFMLVKGADFEDRSRV
jgi:hypothetical protein